MQTRQLGRSQIQSADAAGISERTGRDLDHGGRAVRGGEAAMSAVGWFAWSTDVLALVIEVPHRR